MDWAGVISGFAVGAIVGMTGVGGGSLMTPVLIGWLGVPPAVAVGTDLIFAAITKGFGSLVHWRQAQVDWPIVTRMIASSSVGALLTLAVVARLGESDAVAHGVRSALGVALLLTAAAVLLRQRLHDWAAARPFFRDTRAQHRATLVLGALIGVLVTLSSVGAGAVGVTALMLIYPLVPARIIVGSDIAYAVPLTLIAGLGHVALGHLDATLLATLLVGSLPGIWLGARLSARMPERALRTLLFGCLAFAGLKVIS